MQRYARLCGQLHRRGLRLTFQLLKELSEPAFIIVVMEGSPIDPTDTGSVDRYFLLAVDPLLRSLGDPSHGEPGERSPYRENDTNHYCFHKAPICERTYNASKVRKCTVIRQKPRMHARLFLVSLWCRGRDSNPRPLRERVLNPPRIPAPPPRHVRTRGSAPACPNGRSCARTRGNLDAPTYRHVRNRTSQVTLLQSGGAMIQ